MLSRFREKLFALMLLAWMLSASGCLYIPPLGSQFTEEKRSEIVLGKTTKDHVVEIFGEPNILNNPRFFIYETQRSLGTIWFFAAAGYSGGIFPVPVKEQHYYVLLCFNDQNIIDRYEVEAAKTRLLEGEVPENLENGANRLNGELLFKGKDKDILGFETGIGFNSLAISSDGGMLGAGGFKLVGGSLSSKKIWMKNLVTGELRVIDTPAYDKAVFSNDLTRVALLNRTVNIIETTTGKSLLVYEGHGNSSFWSLKGASCIAYDHAGRFVASGGFQGNIRIWDSHTGKERISFKGHDKEVLSIAWNHDDQLLATIGLDGLLKMWRTTTGEEIFMTKQRAGKLSFSPDGKVLAVNCGSHIELWRIKFNSDHVNQVHGVELYNAILLPYFYTASREISLAWSLDGRLLAAGNGSVIVYDVDKGAKVLRLTPQGLFLHPTDPNNASHTLEFSPDGKSIFTGTNEGIYRYPVMAAEE